MDPAVEQRLIAQVAATFLGITLDDSPPLAPDQEKELDFLVSMVKEHGGLIKKETTATVSDDDQDDQGEDHESNAEVKEKQEYLKKFLEALGRDPECADRMLRVVRDLLRLVGEEDLETMCGKEVLNQAFPGIIGENGLDLGVMLKLDKEEAGYAMYEMFWRAFTPGTPEYGTEINRKTLCILDRNLQRPLYAFEEIHLFKLLLEDKEDNVAELEFFMDKVAVFEAVPGVATVAVEKFSGSGFVNKLEAMKAKGVKLDPKCLDDMDPRLLCHFMIHSCPNCRQIVGILFDMGINWDHSVNAYLTMNMEREEDMNNRLFVFDGKPLRGCKGPKVKPHQLKKLKKQKKYAEGLLSRGPEVGFIRFLLMKNVPVFDRFYVTAAIDRGVFLALFVAFYRSFQRGLPVDIPNVSDLYSSMFADNFAHIARMKTPQPYIAEVAAALDDLVVRCVPDCPINFRYKLSLVSGKKVEMPTLQQLCIRNVRKHQFNVEASMGLPVLDHKNYEVMHNLPVAGDLQLPESIAQSLPVNIRKILDLSDLMEKVKNAIKGAGKKLPENIQNMLAKFCETF